MTEHENRELARIERELHGRVDALIWWAKWVLGGVGGAALLVAVTTVPWIWMLSSRTVTLQERVAQHSDIFNQRAGYLPRVDSIESQVTIDRANFYQALEEIRRSLERLEERQYEGRNSDRPSGSRQTKP